VAMVGMDDSSLHADSQPKLVGLSLRVSSCLALFYIRQTNQVNSCNDFVMTTAP